MSTIKKWYNEKNNERRFAMDVNSIRETLTDGLLYAARNVNLDAATEARFVDLLQRVRDAVQDGGWTMSELLGDVIDAVQERVAGEDEDEAE
jgi:hypothetical protein